MEEQKTRREIIKLLALGGIGVGAAFYGIRMPDENQPINTRDGIATIASGFLAHSLYGPSRIEATQHVPYWFDSKLKGEISKNSINLRKDNYATFKAREGPDGLEGELEKPGLNWLIKQKGSRSPYFDISSHMNRTDSRLFLEAKGGKINGGYAGQSGDWPITGSYDQNGRIHILVAGPGRDASVSGSVYRR
jgi:hypothetical protein